MKYMIAPGKSFTTLKSGIVSEYQEVTPKRIGSQSLFESLLKQGAIVEFSNRPEVVHSVDFRIPRKTKEQFPDRKLSAPAVAEVKKVEVIEPIKKKEKEEKPKKELFGCDDDLINDVDLDEQTNKEHWDKVD